MRVAYRAFAIAAVPAFFALVILPLTGCGANWRAIMPGGVTAADEEWVGTKTGETLSVIGTVDPRAAAAYALFEGLEGQAAKDPFGVVMPLTMIGETTPRWVKCTGEFVERCKDYPVLTKVHFAGSLSGPFWVPKRLRGEDVPD